MNSQKEFNQVILTTAIFGILTFALVPVTVGLYFIYEEPPVWNVLARALISILSLLFTVVFFTGFLYTTKKLTKDYYWLLTLMFALVCIWTATAFVAHSLEAGGVLNPKGISPDPTQEGILAQGNYLLYGSIGRVLMTAFMFLIFFITIKTKIFPKWTAWLALSIAVVNAFFIPSMFFGTNAADFYSAIGWGNSAVSASLFTIWMLAVSITMLVKRRALNRYVTDGEKKTEKAAAK